MEHVELLGPVEAPELQVMTFNIRRRMRVDPRPADTWSRRAPAIQTVLTEAKPTLLGVQEALAGQAALLRRFLGRGYRMLGHGRDADGRGEGTPMFYDAHRLKLVEWHQEALSATPDVPGSRTWGNPTPRMLVRAVFDDRETGIRFLAINTHFDQLSRTSRIRAAERMRELLTTSGLPGILTGDLNTGEDTEPIEALLAGGPDTALLDAWHSARRRLGPEWGTFTNYRDPKTRHKRIDWIVVTPGVEVDRVLLAPRRPDGVWPSDHIPVQAVVRLPAPAAA